MSICGKNMMQELSVYAIIAVLHFKCLWIRGRKKYLYGKEDFCTNTRPRLPGRATVVSVLQTKPKTKGLNPEGVLEKGNTPGVANVQSYEYVFFILKCSRTFTAIHRTLQ